MTPKEVTDTPRQMREAARLGGLTIRGRKRRSLARFLTVLAPFVAFAALTWALYGRELLGLIGGRV